MKNRKATPRILLDTTFILPSLGIETGKEVTQSLRKLADTRAEICFSRFSILESLWVISRVLKTTDFNTERFSLGLRSVLESGRYTKIEENSEIFQEALKLYKLGHRDMIDNILYASSVFLNLKLLTLDNELRKFIIRKGLEDTILSPKQEF